MYTKTLELYRICKCCVLGNQKQNDLAKSGVSKKNEDDCYQEKIHFQAMNLISLAVQTASVKIWCEWFYQTKVTMSTKSMDFRVHQCTRIDTVCFELSPF